MEETRLVKNAKILLYMHSLGSLKQKALLRKHCCSNLYVFLRMDNIRAREKDSLSLFRKRVQFFWCRFSAEFFYDFSIILEANCSLSLASFFPQLVCLSDRYNFPLIVFCSGCNFLTMAAIFFTVSSFDNPVRLLLNFCNRSLLVIGFRVRYLLTASSVIP